MWWLRMIAASALGALFLAAAGGNVAIVIRGLLWPKARHISMVPVVGGFFGALALFAVPVDGVGRWAWIPPLLDLGCLPMIGAALWALASGRN